MQIDKSAVKKGMFITGATCPAVTTGIEPVRFGQSLPDLSAIRARLAAAQKRLKEIEAVLHGEKARQ